MQRVVGIRDVCAVAGNTVIMKPVEKFVGIAWCLRHKPRNRPVPFWSRELVFHAGWFMRAGELDSQIGLHGDAGFLA